MKDTFKYRILNIWGMLWVYIYDLWGFLGLPTFRKDNTMNPIWEWIIKQMGWVAVVPEMRDNK